jgi:hypothetical protein
MKKKTPFAIIVKKNSIPLSIALLATLLIGFFIFSNSQQYLAGLRQAQTVDAYGAFGSQPIKKLNNHYLIDTTGKPVFFAGYYSWASINPDSYVDHPSKYKDMIDLMAENNLDYLRLELGMNRIVTNDRGLTLDSPGLFAYDTTNGSQYPQAKANLDQFDSRFFSGMDNIIQYATNKKINVHLSIFDGVNISYGRGENDTGPGQCTDPFTGSFYRWCNSAWNLDNQTRSFFGQIDKTPLGGTGFDGDFYQYKTDSNGKPYLDSTPGTLNFYQRKVIAEIINKTRQYNNVFYEVGNEMYNMYYSQNKAWHEAVVSYAKSIAPDRVITANYKLDPTQDWGNFDALARHDGDQATDILVALEQSYPKNNPMIMDPDGSKLKGVDVVMTRREGGVVRFEDELRKAAWYAFISQGAGWGGFTHDWWDYNPNYDDSCDCIRIPGLTQPAERIAEIKKDAANGNELAVELINIPKFYGFLKKFINESNVEFWNMSSKKFTQDYQNYNNRMLEQSGKAIIGFVNYGDSVTVNTSSQGNTLLLKYYNPLTGQWSAQQRISNSGSIDLNRPISASDPEKKDWAFLIQTEGSTTPTNRLPTGAFVSLTSPSANTIKVQANASDPDSTGPVSIKIYDSGTLLHTSSTNDLNQTLTNIAAGTHTIKVTATDIQNGQEVELTGSPKSVTVQGATSANRLPQGTLSSVTSPDLNTIRIIATSIYDPDASTTPVKINIYDNGSIVKSVTGTSLSETISNISTGTHSIKVTAVDIQTQQEVELTGSPKSILVEGPVQTLPFPPAKVSGLKYSCSADGTSVTLSWNPSSYASGYWIRSDRQSDVWTDTCPLSSVNGSDLCIGTSSTNAYTQTSYTYSVTPNTDYNLWVHAVSTVGVSQPTSTAFICNKTVATAPPTIVPTIAPTLVPTTIPTTKPTVVPTIAPTAAPTPIQTGSEITIYAGGQPAKGVWPQIGVTVIGEKNGDIINVITRDIRAYTYKPRNNATVNQLQFNFINDYYEVQKDTSGNTVSVQDRNLRIQKVVQNGQAFNSRDNSTYSVGSWTAAKGCSSSGYLSSEWLHCQWAYFRFNQR